MNMEKTCTYGEPIENIIQRRKSVRTYSRMPIQSEVIEKLQKYFQQLKGPFPVAVRLEIINKLKIKADAKIKLGTYGIIQGASCFIAAAVEKKEHSLEQLGYMFEDLVLYITSLGLGTCWLGGTFNKQGFSRAMQIKEDEWLPIATPVGCESQKRSLIDMFMKPNPNVKKRKPWNEIFFKESFNTILDMTDAGIYTKPLEMLRLAPSASNKQPWRIILINGNFRFYLAHDSVYAAVFPYDIQKIDMGIAMCHFELTANEVGLRGKWDINTPVPDDVPKGWEYIITWVPIAY